MNRPSHFLLLLFLALPVFIGGAPRAVAQAPKLGDWYENASSLGFKVRMPKAWAFIPPAPDEPNLLGKYDPVSVKAFSTGGKQMSLRAWVVSFDRRHDLAAELDIEETPADGDGDGDGDEDEVEETPEERKERIQNRRRAQKYRKDLSSWMELYLPGKDFELHREKTTKLDGVQAVERIYDVAGYKVYTMLYQLEPEVDVAVVFNGPGDGKKWRKFESIHRRMARSFKRVDVEVVDAAAELAGMSPLRAKKKAVLLAEVQRTPGWELYETPNYFVISNKDDRQFIRELLERLEAIREVYEEHYDADQAKAMRLAARKKQEEEAGEATDAPADPGERRTTAAAADPMEMSRTSVVRVCASKGQYHSYGGPAGSAGYWNWVDEELVIYEDKPRTRTWATLNHEAFHQYIYYFYGNISPHSWYNEGTGDFYSGYKYKNKKFKLKPFDWRVSTIKTAVREGTYVPLSEIVRYSKAEYYDRSSVGRNYAQGWSFIYFLRTGKKNASHWNDDWDSILDTYLETLASTGDLDTAVDRAFATVDWDELEQAWKDYTK